MGKAQSIAVVVVAALCSLLPLGAQFYAEGVGGNLGIDTHAYYCAAQAQRHGMSPYFSSSIDACERQAPRGYYRPPPHVTVPAPYPPYALALFSPLTLLPFATAAIVWWTLLVLALILTACALARITGQPWLVAWGVIVLSAGLTAFSGGNAFPVALAAVVLAALAVVRARPVFAAIAVGVAMAEPHVALPAAVGLFAGYSVIRLPLVIVFGVLAACSLAVGGVSQNFMYVFSVVPAHALSEVSRDNQYSLSTVIAAFGTPDAAAAFAGTLCYIVMLALGVAVAIALARRFNEPALLVLVPPAFSLFGGSFVHVTEIAAAVPACLLIFARAQMYRAWFFAALILLAIPWLMSGSAAMFLAPAYPIGYIIYVLWRSELKYALAGAVISLAVILALFTIAAVPWPHHAIAHAYPAIDPRLAEASWRALVLGNSTNRPATLLLRLPTWAGLAALVVPLLILARRKGVALVPQVSS
jgi:hypothetical protein